MEYQFLSHLQRFFRRKPAKDLLPTKPIEQKVIQAWWRVRNGFVTEDDIKVTVAHYSPNFSDEITRASRKKVYAFGGF